MEFKDFESSAISSLTTNEDSLTIVFKSSDKEYSYTINDTKWVENLTNTINNKESIGKFVSTSLKHKNIVENKDNSK
jgi:hypothetical protein|tara:strand:- start:667 stop:897 length:231 start_codon:yes stop_codon:yes gene_type:complete